ncbi:hypothetical protein Phum_PHUM476110 [Pediculus humanus corporis]|uniref:Uncharacterized protein n=1 Tax=Pediculus humanus subsp. corporis TaxID=121224 RepID=E0VW92_PEDHC|nr:uncharacterized protein Phum_PHUM476110 [Pediculus humanus corporis]EEB17648.1 hypothetical protein Phum_PHUM476110 [Pediculus humanus corporis]
MSARRLQEQEGSIKWKREVNETSTGGRGEGRRSKREECGKTKFLSKRPWHSSEIGKNSTTTTTGGC